MQFWGEYSSGTYISFPLFITKTRAEIIKSTFNGLPIGILYQKELHPIRTPGLMDIRFA